MYNVRNLYIMRVCAVIVLLFGDLEHVVQLSVQQSVL